MMLFGTKIEGYSITIWFISLLEIILQCDNDIKFQANFDIISKYLTCQTV